MKSYRYVFRFLVETLRLTHVCVLEVMYVACPENRNNSEKGVGQISRSAVVMRA